MTNSRLTTALLLVIGTLLTVLGGWRLLAPVSFFAMHDLQLDAVPGHLSEARAMGGVVVGFAILILLGGLFDRMRRTSLLVAVVLFFAFAFGRLVGVAFDGNPGPMIVQGIVSELVLGSLALLALLRFRNREDNLR